jgi:hypothetical protein
MLLFAFLAGLVAGRAVTDCLARKTIREELRRWDDQQPDQTNRRRNP